MGVTRLVKELEMELEMGLQESQNQRDKRVEDLWKRLDVQQTGYLDFKGLQRGLRRIDHPLKNADEMLRHMMSRLDDNSDGKIDFDEFRTFVEETEKKLLLLFHTIDRDQNGKLDKAELREAFRKAGLVVPNRKLDAFFNDIDYNNDGYISFGEWRDFLLFMPVHKADAPLAAVLDFYASIVTLSAEGDSMVSEETLEGLGTTGFLLQTLFGSILRIASPWDSSPSSSSSSVSGPSPPSQDLSSSSLSPPPYLHEGLDAAGSKTASTTQTATSSSPTPLSHLPGRQELDPDSMEAAILQAYAAALDASRAEERAAIAKSQRLATEGTGTSETTTTPAPAVTRTLYPTITTASSAPASASATITTTTMSTKGPLSDATASPSTDTGTERPKKKSKLTTYVPDPGYFVAGALAGGISRTATAPLDRLKVYLLVRTQSSGDTALQALKQGRLLEALRNAGKPIGDGIKDLWRAGGIRSLFAGESRNGLNVIKIMPESAIKFGSYEAAKRALAKLEGHDDPKRINSYSKFTAGGIAGMVAQFCVYPLDTLKFRLQTSTVQGGLTGNALVIETAKKMWQAGGMRSAYRGVTMGLIGMFPYSAIDMGTFELLKNSYKKYMVKYHGIHEEDAKPGNIVTGIIGASSGAFGASVVYPLNVLRTRLQTQGTVMHPATYTGIWDVARTTFRNEGVRGMYKGLAPNLLKVAPALSITWVMYENSKKMLGLD
ncbi:calcium-binding mitochondrial carrier [Plectosphaerella plurivora]|uniref:Mitochondrial thiamine pyrophosphate carrier 1 n=1 Tax=Plectosphaerella plurivora TaxID=936078 RepID=A0A9P8VDH0_9PEZI|nr:calcium-binding mitochondrial carrier [Plectosphaerella plurivora]